ncbi:molecular chaperone HtpG [Fusibacter sp. Q10-2]|uniref:Molecular chaperone HtpG n=2 Tax=Fusibacter ferrireducens TaxID=2785058 RepID=A0ABR9ZZJ5_9FIRM|nr:molecular chaperone HtpG [Fusibacter ferrireducens]
MEKGSLSIHSENIFPIIKKWLYSDHDIFVRELVSNASDAITKLKQLSMMNEAKIEENPTFKIDVMLDEASKTITISDNGLGMTDEEIKKYINQIAFSGAEDFLNQYKDKSDKEQIIGHFGLGFYSAFMVAEKVEIHTLSYKKDAQPVIWHCEGGTEFEMKEGTRQTRGTDIILHVGDDGKDFLNEFTLKETLQKYCSFMPYEIYFTVVGKAPETDEEGHVIIEEPKPINTILPLYAKSPSDCTDEEYKEFYRNTFKDFREPLFWIHLNMDYPFNLKGILYFPKFNTEFDSLEGQIKLYNSQVFVADNIKEVIPEFLLLLKGVIDCPDLPLNVSRSFLQNDGFVRKISNYITKKVGDKLNGLFKTERETFEGFWDDINPFIKFGGLKDEKFFESIQKIYLFKTIYDKYVTLDEYLENAEEKKVFYVTDRLLQSQYINLFKAHELNAVILEHSIDTAFISHMEAKNEGVSFTRVDSDLTDHMKESDDSIDPEHIKKVQNDLTGAFKSAVGLEKVTLKIENMKDASIASMMTLSEEARRMQDMMKMYGMGSMGSLDPNMFKPETTLLLNHKHPLVKYLMSHIESYKEVIEKEVPNEVPNTDSKADENKDSENKEAAEPATKIVKETHYHVDEMGQLIMEQLYDLALLAHSQLSPDAMTQFIKRSNTLLSRLI